MTLNRTPIRERVSGLLYEFQTNAIGNEVVWRVVNAVLDLVDEQLARGAALTGQSWVITYFGRPIAVCATRARARRVLKRAMLAREDTNRSHYVITPTKIEE